MKTTGRAKYVLAAGLLGIAVSGWPQSAARYNQTILADRPVMFLTMDAPTAGSQPDLSGRGNNGTYVGGAGAARLPNGEIAAEFNGVNQYLTVRATPELSVPTSGVITIESWIRPSTLQFSRTEQEDYVYFLGKGNPSDGYEYANRMYSKVNSAGRPNRTSVYAWNTSGALGSGAYFQDTLNTTDWIMVTDVINMRDRSTAYPTGYISIYKNGRLRGKVRLDQYNVTPGKTNAPFNVGTRNYNSWFQGAVGKVAVYDYELTATQIANHYAAMTGSAPPPGPVPGPGPGPGSPTVVEFRSAQRFLSPGTVDGVNDVAVFGPGATELEVFDTLGRKIYAGSRGSASLLSWDGRDSSGRIVDSGMYVVRILQSNGHTGFQSLAIVK